MITRFDAKALLPATFTTSTATPAPSWQYDLGTYCRTEDVLQALESAYRLGEKNGYQAGYDQGDLDGWSDCLEGMRRGGMRLEDEEEDCASC